MVSHLFGRPEYEILNEVVDNLQVTDEKDILLLETKEWLESETRALMIKGERYYRNKPDIFDKKKANLQWQSNITMAHDITKKLVNQKVGYLLSKEPSISTDDKAYAKLLDEGVFTQKFLKTLKNLGKEAINKGISYLYVYYDELGNFSLKKFKSEQIKPFWKDDDHTEMYGFLRVYDEMIYQDGKKVMVTKVEYHHELGIKYFVLDKGKLIPDAARDIETNYHFMLNDQPMLWERIPLIPFKYNEEEEPLIESIKTLVDNYNMQASVNADLLADIPQFIYILKNYQGEDLKGFVEKLNLYRALNVAENGGLDKLQSTPQTEAATSEIDRVRTAIYEFGRGIDNTDEDLGNASGTALRYRYADLDMDCNTLETEFQSSLEQLMFFVNVHFSITMNKDFSDEPVKIIFNRDIIINESEVIKDCKESVGIIDDVTIRENHPWYTYEVEERLMAQLAAQSKAQAQESQEEQIEGAGADE